MTKMAATTIYCKKKTFKYLLWNRWADFHETWYVAFGVPAHQICVLAAGKRISSFLIEQKFSHNLVMVGSSGLGGTISNQVGCWQTNLKLSYITESHRVHGARLLLLKGKYAKTSFDELSWKILNESRLFLHIIISLSNELFYLECL